MSRPVDGRLEPARELPEDALEPEPGEVPLEPLVEFDEEPRLFPPLELAASTLTVPFMLGCTLQK